jgi:hypothetical protein
MKTENVRFLARLFSSTIIVKVYCKKFHIKKKNEKKTFIEMMMPVLSDLLCIYLSEFYKVLFALEYFKPFCLFTAFGFFPKRMEKVCNSKRKLYPLTRIWQNGNLLFPRILFFLHSFSN